MKQRNIYAACILFLLFLCSCSSDDRNDFRSVFPNISYSDGYAEMIGLAPSIKDHEAEIIEKSIEGGIENAKLPDNTYSEDYEYHQRTFIWNLDDGSQCRSTCWYIKEKGELIAAWIESLVLKDDITQNDTLTFYSPDSTKEEIVSAMTEDVGNLLSDSAVEPLTEFMKTQAEGYYELIASEYPEAQQYDSGFDALKITDGVLYGFSFHRGEWTEIGPLLHVTVSEEKMNRIFQNVTVSEDYMVDLPGLFDRMEYRTVYGNREYYMTKIANDLHMACIKDGNLEWMKQILKTDEIQDRYAYACTLEEEALPHTLDLSIFDRSYLLVVPSTNYVSEGTFRFNEGELILSDNETKTEFTFIEEEYCYILQDNDKNGFGLKKGEIFRNSSWKYLRDLYGSACIDLDGDGNSEMVWLGDLGLSGPFALTIAVDSKGTDAFRWYYAEHGEVSLIEENGHLYVEILYRPWNGEPSKGRFEIRYDGKTVWITDENGNTIENNIDLRKP